MSKKVKTIKGCVANPNFKIPIEDCISVDKNRSNTGYISDSKGIPCKKPGQGVPEECFKPSKSTTSPSPSPTTVPQQSVSTPAISKSDTTKFNDITGCLPNPKVPVNKGDCFKTTDCGTGYKSKSTGLCCIKDPPAGCIDTSLSSAPTTKLPSITPSISTITKKSFNTLEGAPDQGVNGCLINSNLGNIPKNDCVFKFGKYVSPSMGNAECKQPEVAPAECFNTNNLLASPTTKPVNTPVPVIAQNSPDQGVNGCLIDSGLGNISKNSCELKQNGKYYSAGSQCKDPGSAPDICFKETPSVSSRSSVNPEDDPEYVARIRREQYDKMIEERKRDDEKFKEGFGSMTKTNKTLVIVGSILGSLLLLFLIIKISKKIKK
jgi:hypothetical protein